MLRRARNVNNQNRENIMLTAINITDIVETISRTSKNISGTTAEGYMIEKYAIDIAKIIEGAASQDMEKVCGYAEHLVKKLQADGEVAAAQRISDALEPSSAKMMAPAYARGGNGSVAKIPVDSDSAIPIADEFHPKRGSVDICFDSATADAVVRFLRYFRESSRLAANGIPFVPSMLMHGPPGCGKTLLAKYIASELEMPLITARTDGLISSYLGNTAKNLRMLFEHAMSRPCVLFLDEFDALAKMRDDARELGELKRVVISLLQNIDAMGPDHVLIAATNHEHLLDPAIWRRFAYKLRIDFPDHSSREYMLRRFLGKFADDEIVEIMGSLTDGLSGAQIRDVAGEAVRECVLSADSKLNLHNLIRSAQVLRNPESTEPITVSDSLCIIHEVDPKKFNQPRLSKMFGISQPRVSQILRAHRNGRAVK